MKRPPSKLSTGSTPCCHFPLAGRNVTVTNTLAMAPLATPRWKPEAASLGKNNQRHTSAEFVAFLNELIATQPPGKAIHAIVDNLSAHKTKRVTEFLAANPNLTLHYTPTYSPGSTRLNWFSKIQRDLIARGIFSSKHDLSKKICVTFVIQQNRQTFQMDLSRSFAPHLTLCIFI